MTPTNGTNVNFTVTTASNPMSVNNTGDLYYLTREPIENLKPSSRTAADTSYYSRYTPKMTQHQNFIQLMHYLLI